MTYRTLIKPTLLFITISIVYVGLYLLFLLGIVGSFLIQERAFSSIGFLHLMLLLGYSYLGLLLSTRIRIRKTELRQKNRISLDIVYPVIILINIVATWALYMGAISSVGLNILSPSFWLYLLGNQYRQQIIWGRGFTILNNLFFVSLTYSCYYYNLGRKKYKTIVWYDIVMIVASSMFYGARLKLVLGLSIVLLSYIRNKDYQKRPNVPLIIIFALLLAFFLSFWGGIRGTVSGIYNKWTENQLLWSMRSFTDYFVSTTMFTTVGLGERKGITLPEIRDRLGPYEIRGYTNFGKYINIYNQFGFLDFIYVFVTYFAYGITWKHFDRGDKFGQLFYPFSFYFILEGLRIESILVLDFQFTLIVVFILYFLPDGKTQTSAA